MRFSFVAIAREALSGNRGWPEQWRSASAKPSYDAVIVGAGGHGLAAAYYLAQDMGWTNVAVLDKGYLGGGNTGRNTTIIRSNYLWEESEAIYEVRTQASGGGVELRGAQLQRDVLGARGDDARAQPSMTLQVFKRHMHANLLGRHR